MGNNKNTIHVLCPLAITNDMHMMIYVQDKIDKKGAGRLLFALLNLSDSSWQIVFKFTSSIYFIHIWSEKMLEQEL